MNRNLPEGPGSVLGGECVEGLLSYSLTLPDKLPLPLAAPLFGIIHTQWVERKVGFCPAHWHARKNIPPNKQIPKSILPSERTTLSTTHHLWGTNSEPKGPMRKTTDLTLP